jgi:hypothetical protein
MVDVFLDRRLTRDDNRGVAQGVTDNREIISTFKLLFEPRHTVNENPFRKKEIFLIFLFLRSLIERPYQAIHHS